MDRNSKSKARVTRALLFNAVTLREAQERSRRICVSSHRSNVQPQYFPNAATPLALSPFYIHSGQMKVLTRFVTSAADPKQFPPPGAPEIAFVGRSNVGKSSLINTLVGNKIAKTSNTPGRTQTINFFQVRRPGKPHPDFVFADLPGYGFARVPKEITAQWAKFINPYLADRESLALCVVLVDVNIPPQELDVQLLE